MAGPFIFIPTQSCARAWLRLTQYIIQKNVYLLIDGLDTTYSFPTSFIHLLHLSKKNTSTYPVKVDVNIPRYAWMNRFKVRLRKLHSWVLAKITQWCVHRGACHDNASGNCHCNGTSVIPFSKKKHHPLATSFIKGIVEPICQYIYLFLYIFIPEPSNSAYPGLLENNQL